MQPVNFNMYKLFVTMKRENRISESNHTQPRNLVPQIYLFRLICAT